VDHCCVTLGLAERRVCRVLGQPRSTQRYQRQPPDDEAPLTAAIIRLASQYGRYGYRQVTGLLRNDGWRVNHKRVERIWRQEGLKVPKKQPPRRRLWLTDGSCVQLRAERPNHVWAYDFMATRTEDGRPVKLLTIVDEYTRECLAIDVARRLRSDDVLFRLAE
jgi:transposase InsO family protein